MTLDNTTTETPTSAMQAGADVAITSNDIGGSPQPTVAVPNGQVPTSTNVAVISSTDLQREIAQASTAYVSARTNAARSAAAVYYVWVHACSAAASEENKAWFCAEVAKRTAQIDTHNAKIGLNRTVEEKKLKEAVARLQNVVREANDPTRIETLEREIKALRTDSDLRRRDLTATRMVKLEMRSDAEDYTLITKFALELHDPKQASQVNRFAKVVTWIAAKFKANARATIDEIADAVLKAGGFDNVYVMQQAVDGKGEKAVQETASQTASNNNDQTAQAVVEHFRQVVASARSLGSVSIDHRHEQDSLVALIGRVGVDGITVISDISMPVDEVLRLCADKQDSKLLPGDAGSEFVAVALAAGELVEEGKPATGKGEAPEVTRELSMLNSTDGAMLVISARNTDVSMVVHAEPKAQASSLMHKPGIWRLRRVDVELLEKRLADRVVRKMVTLSVDDDERQVGNDLLLSELAWHSTNGLLATNGDAAATNMHPWLAMSPNEEAPLNIDGFAPAGTVTLSRDELQKLVNGQLGAWHAEKAGSKVDAKQAAIASVVFGKSAIKVTSIKGDDVVVCDGAMKGKVTLKFRPRTLAKVLQKVGELSAGAVELSPDDRGVLCASFETAYGHYSIFVPACDDQGVLEKARFHAIRVPETDSE